MEILNTSILLSASSTTNQQHAVEEDSKAKGVLLAGFLIILKLSIQSLVIKLHKRKILENSEGESKDSDILVPVLSSSNEDHFINACILVDIPPGTGEGDQAASDVQISLSALDVILKKDLIALLVEPKVRAYLAQTLYCFRKMLINVGVLLDESLIVEHSHDCFGVPSVMLRNLRAKMTASSFALEEDPSGSMDRHKQAVASYLNTSRYYKIFCSILPKGVLSFALRMSFIHANLLSSTSIKSFLIISMQDLFDRALSDPNSTQSLYSRNALNAYLKQAAKKTIRKSTKIGQRMSNSMFSGKPGVKTSAMAKLDPISVEIKKATDPIPLITLNCAGFNLSLPIDDDTICRGLAIVMNQILPFYSIHTAPPPEVSLGDSDEEEDEEAHKEVSPAIEAPISDPQHTKLEEAAPSVPMQETSGTCLPVESDALL